MDSATYESILAALLATPPTAFPHLSQIASKHSVEVPTVFSIYSQETQYQVMRTHREFVKASKQLFRLYLLDQITIAEICTSWRLQPCLVWRRLFQSSSLLNGRVHPNQNNVPKKAINEVFKEPTVLASYVIDDAVSVLAKELDLDELPRLYNSQDQLIEKITKDVEEAVMIDMVMGPKSDEARRLAGLKYEGKLYEHLKEHDIAFWTEDELRELNFIKTPDALLKVPIAVKGRVVTWIDSKATFADSRQHAKLLAEQYAGYINRFGPGCSIYWHSYLKDVEDSSPDLVVIDRWPRPEDLMQLPRNLQ